MKYLNLYDVCVILLAVISFTIPSLVSAADMPAITLYIPSLQ